MKKFLYILPFAALLCTTSLFSSCDNNGNNANTPQDPDLIALQQGCYSSGDTAFVILFPADQHGGQYVTIAYMSDSMMIAMRPELLTGYNDTTGTAAFVADDALVSMRTNGKDSVWLTGADETMVFVRQAEVDNAPKKLTGTWRMSFEINAYMSYRLWDAVIGDDLHCDVEFNIPDSATLAMMLNMSGALEGLPDAAGMFEGIPLGQMLAAIPTGLAGDVWYSAYAGMGVFVPDLEGYNSNYGLYFTTPDGTTIRISFGSMNFDMTRLK